MAPTSLTSHAASHLKQLHFVTLGIVTVSCATTTALTPWPSPHSEQVKSTGFEAFWALRMLRPRLLMSQKVGIELGDDRLFAGLASAVRKQFDRCAAYDLVVDCWLFRCISTDRFCRPILTTQTLTREQEVLYDDSP